jgi:peptide/nickel transport system substrate-binding protein
MERAQRAHSGWRAADILDGLGKRVLRSLRHCGTEVPTGDRGNYSGYSNPQFDAALDRALLAVDADVRKDAYFDAQQILFDDAPAIFGYSLMETEAARSDVLNWQPSMDSRVNLHDVGLGAGRYYRSGPVCRQDSHAGSRSLSRQATETVIRNMFDALVTRTWDGRVVPEIAEGVESRIGYGVSLSDPQGNQVPQRRFARCR